MDFWGTELEFCYNGNEKRIYIDIRTFGMDFKEKLSTAKIHTFCCYE